VIIYNPHHGLFIHQPINSIRLECVICWHHYRKSDESVWIESVSTYQIKLMQAIDIHDVFGLQLVCYQADFHEPIQTIADRYNQSPQTAWLVWHDHQLVGYLIAYPSLLGKLTALGDHFKIAQRPDCLYVHDLAVAPWVAGQGVAAQLITQAWAYAHMQGWHGSALVAVQDSQAFWQKYGYQPMCVDTTQQQNLMSYGQDACYMTQRWSISR
jgi:GNAT superfamily N-acetyltransferase